MTQPNSSNLNSIAFIQYIKTHDTTLNDIKFELPQIYYVP